MSHDSWPYGLAVAALVTAAGESLGAMLPPSNNTHKNNTQNTNTHTLSLTLPPSLSLSLARVGLRFRPYTWSSASGGKVGVARMMGSEWFILIRFDHQCDELWSMVGLQTHHSCPSSPQTTRGVPVPSDEMLVFPKKRRMEPYLKLRTLPCRVQGELGKTKVLLTLPFSRHRREKTLACGRGGGHGAGSLAGCATAWTLKRGRKRLKGRSKWDRAGKPAVNPRLNMSAHLPGPKNTSLQFWRHNKKVDQQEQVQRSKGQFALGK